MNWGKRKTILLVVSAVVLIGAAALCGVWAARDKGSENPVKVVDLRNDGPAEEDQFYVYVTGAVKTPGVYEIPRGSHVFDAVRAAGDVLPYADIDQIDMAGEVTESCRIYIPLNPDKVDIGAIGKVNINTAGEKELESLPGVGAVTAEKIINYRKEHGFFEAKEDIKKVPSIGESKFKKMADRITL